MRIKTKAFTLIELMIVVAIIGILAAVAVPKFAEMLRKSKEGSTKGALTNFRSALTIYVSDNEGLTPYAGVNGTYADLTSVVPKYLEAIPTVKLGNYHDDSDRVLNRSTVSDRGVTASLYDASGTGWIYTSSSGAMVFVECTHTDTKNVWFTNW